LGHFEQESSTPQNRHRRLNNPREASAVSTTRIHILTPSTGTVSHAWAETFGVLQRLADERGVAIDRTYATDRGHLVHARNTLFAAGADGLSPQTPASHVLWWDADVAFAPDLVFELLERPEEMIVRPYPLQGQDWAGVENHLRDGGSLHAVDLEAAAIRWSVGLELSHGKLHWSEDHMLVEAAQSGFGWVLMRVEALRDFERHGGFMDGRDWRDHRFVRAFDLYHLRPGLLRDYQAPGEANACGEDVAFCRRWRESAESGYRRIWCAPHGRVSNAGRSGDYADYLRRTFGT
jgi:hypothetical protein